MVSSVLHCTDSMCTCAKVSARYMYNVGNECMTNGSVLGIIEENSPDIPFCMQPL